MLLKNIQRVSRTFLLLSVIPSGSNFTKQINEHIITTINEAQQAIKAYSGATEITINFAINEPVSGIHPTEGIPILFSDQLNVISKTLNALRSQINTNLVSKPNPEKPPEQTVQSDFNYKPGVYNINMIRTVIEQKCQQMKNL
jgi:hypothetical protein